jgi:hydroxyethylthiazole kinase-like uncharacterized protein yjeF
MDTLQLRDFAEYLKPRPRGLHKGNCGHVLIIGGDFGYSGAPRLAAKAALRVGAGLVSVATRIENAVVMNATCPEIMCHGVGFPEELNNLIERADVIVIGPGLGQSEWAQELANFVFNIPKPMVVDADALSFLTPETERKEQRILTPHPGEAARMLKMTAEEVQEERLIAIQKLHQLYGGVNVLKGAGTLILNSDSTPIMCEAGNPGMATAGMGDVLSGVIGGWVAQGLSLDNAAKLGVLLHASAGDLAAEEGERGMIASDLMPYLRRLANWNE